MSKICGKCKIDKPLTEYTKKKDGKFGVNWQCTLCKREAGSKYYQNNKDRITKYREDTNEKARQKQWRADNQSIKNYHTSVYRAKQQQATPKWLNEDQLLKIRSFYKEAKELSKVTNIQHHVDHIIPLNGEAVSGLHVPWNLQILNFRDNIKKSNKMDNEVIASIVQREFEELRDSKEKLSR